MGYVHETSEAKSPPVLTCRMLEQDGNVTRYTGASGQAVAILGSHMTYLRQSRLKDC